MGSISHYKLGKYLTVHLGWGAYLPKQCPTTKDQQEGQIRKRGPLLAPVVFLTPPIAPYIRRNKNICSWSICLLLDVFLFLSTWSYMCVLSAVSVRWGKKACKRDIHRGFETRGRRHQKSKTGASVAPRKGLMSYIN